MKIPNFKTEDGAVLYRKTVGKQISPQVGRILLDAVDGKVLPPRGQVLDVACGPGTVSLKLATEHPTMKVTGVDSSPAMIDLCQQSALNLQLQNTEFIVMDAEKLEFDEATFSLLTCNLAFPFFLHQEESLYRFRKVLEPGGIVLMTVPGEQTWQEFFEVAEATLGEAVKFARPFMAKFDQASKLPKTMLDVGFQDVQESHYKISFHFQRGAQVLEFFNGLFSLLSYAPPELQEELVQALDTLYPKGFEMTYEAVLVEARKPT